MRRMRSIESQNSLQSYETTQQCLTLGHSCVRTHTEGRLMATKPSCILGINAYDHDVSACLLRDGEVAYAIAKERITRQKHASGFYQEVVDYVLDAEGIALRDIDLVVRN